MKFGHQPTAYWITIPLCGGRGKGKRFATGLFTYQDLFTYRKPKVL